MSDGLWIFAYGSLLWNPGFVPEEAVRARLNGWHRSFCMWSFHFRGTETVPGLVLALDADPDASCEGLALRVRPGEEAEVILSLRERELISDAYEERVLPIGLADGRQVNAIAYVIRRDHRQYACVDAETQALTISRACGLRGRNIEYLANTAAHLVELGIHDPEIEDLLTRAMALQG